MKNLAIPEYKFFFVRFTLIFLLLLTVFLSIFYYNSQSELERRKSNIQVQQKALLVGKKNYIQVVIGSVVRETALLADIANNHEIHRIAGLEDGIEKQQRMARFSQALKAVSQRKEIYDQMRYLDLEGNEVTRVNFNDGRALIVPSNELQKKKHRYYFLEAAKLQHKGIYISPLDLNIEHGEIEVPYKPMIRLSAPVFDKEGNKQGIVIINYLAKYLMEGLGLFNLNGGTNYMLVNSDGYYLYNNLYPEKEFAFMFDNKKEQTIYQQFPELEAQIQAMQSGQIVTSRGVLTIESVGAIGRINPYCFQEYHVTENNSTAWKLISFVAFDKRGDFIKAIEHHQTLVYVAIILSFVLSYWIARYQLKEHINKQRIYTLAHYDNLTGLMNRASFLTQANKILSTSVKSSKVICLLYIDLDDFKPINDQYGHAAGDRVLKHLALMMRKVFGSKALLVRLGGDEFAVLLNSAQHLASPEYYAAALQQMLACPFEVANKVFIPIHSSIGGCFSAAQEISLDDLMHKADMAMYQAKRQGKNQVYFFNDINGPEAE
ncbi:sensor domain-containing diguanylate cyclase [Photobacterium angustum]|uniref:sensor domain-containing diguanylate cyclase n=1 Tax=Photobacterium angustum TaxID=661 RepID=UPI0005E6757F|nr:sensor domain-containing diguanylate cyclase [Photobacterium angustum]KJG17124.1 diguanylate cyclase [Photobacterium angustum]KJG23404.1 diguanylate cyclase [Photobacterium angustum]KJG30446.1 diguanylate cyclase [Photobacterium angustum]PSW94481.1 GGDEF domain-containing protein [Photobacterium angustum]PSX03222.1 GGDEF domain-containing protein [Photobacterium angustum]